MNHHPSAQAHHPAAPEDAPVPGRWFALALLCLAQFMLILDITVINVALPDLSRDIGLLQLPPPGPSPLMPSRSPG